MFRTSVIMTAAAMAVSLVAPLLSAELEQGDDRPKIIRDAGVKALTGMGAKQPQDIDYAVVGFLGCGIYKVAWKDNPQLIKRLYDGLREMQGNTEFNGPGCFDRLILHLKSGVDASFLFDELPHDGPPTSVFVYDIYGTRSLSAVFQEIKHNSQAAALDSRLGQLKIASIETQIPGGSRAPISRESPEGKSIEAKAATIVDWFDPRMANSKVVEAKVIDDLGSKYGSVLLRLGTPISFEVMKLYPEEWGRSDWPVDKEAYFSKLTSDAIVITENVYKPVLAFREVGSGKYYVTGFSLMRRLHEQQGIELYDLPGHPAKDEDYYKPVGMVYKELCAEVAKARAQK